MKVINIHHRTIQQPIESVSPLLKTLASKNDRIWPFEKWPRMYFKEGLQVGAFGGHGPIRYSVSKIIPNTLIEFQFKKPTGFFGKHYLEIEEIDSSKTRIKHTIDMRTNLWGSVMWILAIRPLHDALLEDALDKIENQFGSQKKQTPWNLWVRFLRFLLK